MIWLFKKSNNAYFMFFFIFLVLVVFPSESSQSSVLNPGLVTDSESLTAEVINSVKEPGMDVSDSIRPSQDYGTLILHSEPDGAQITVEGHPDLSQRTPYTYELLPGSYRIRLELDRYETEEIVLEIPPAGVKSRTVELTPTYGFLIVFGRGTLRIRPHGKEEFDRLEYQPGQSVELPVGRYQLEFDRDYYETVRDPIVIEPGSQRRWDPPERPLYGRLRIEANTRVSLDLDRGHAPQAPPGADYVYMESGHHEVSISATGYVTEDIVVDIPAGGIVDTSITLMTIAEAEDMQRRSELPRGVIMAAADITGAEIWINGEMAGRGSANATVLTGTHLVEFRHDTGNRTESVYVAPAEMEHVFIELRPSRANAVALSALLPGGGHLYTDRSRGYVYGAAFLSAVAGSYLTWQHYQDKDSDYSSALNDYERAQRDYRQASSLETASRYRDEMDRLFHDRIPGLHDDRSQAFDRFRFLALGAVAIYAVNMLDILLSRPEHGYRTGQPPEGFSVSAAPVGGSNVSAALTWRVSF
ncbi:PEGA domain-containing protein [Balneolaceae bacterium ANBcel3]|nr:PEGA domain-containing protein [Balneolaceae bacterium ANBcel3]